MHYPTIVSIFDLRRPASRAKLLGLVGPEMCSQVESGVHPFAAFVMEGPDGDQQFFGLETETRLIEFYRSLMRMRKGHPEFKIEVIPMELAPETRQALLDAGVLFALEHARPRGSA